MQNKAAGKAADTGHKGPADKKAPDFALPRMQSVWGGHRLTDDLVLRIRYSACQTISLPAPKLAQTFAQVTAQDGKVLFPAWGPRVLGA